MPTTATRTLEHSHTPKAIEQRINAATEHSYLADFVYGAIDGIVTTFAVVSGVAGAGLSSNIIVVLGIANLVGDGFSMAASNYLGTRTDQQLVEKARRMEERHIKFAPEGEREEVRQIYKKKGFDGELLDRIVDVITSNKDRWVDTMLTDELGLQTETPSPLRAASVTFAAFIVIGFIPLLSFVTQLAIPFSANEAYRWSIGLTAVAFAGVGAAKSWFVEERWYRASLETLFVGGTAALLAYLFGVALSSIAA